MFIFLSERVLSSVKGFREMTSFCTGNALWVHA